MTEWWHAVPPGVVARGMLRRKELKLPDVPEGLTEPALLLVLGRDPGSAQPGARLRVAGMPPVPMRVIAPKDKAVGLNATAVKVQRRR